ncbi:MAG: Rrf2 family transcriptional regulator [Planctomycetaceae bacterium]|nr:Rrf2 family transcriptional regulator [Planctomycetaceae bacterium]
MQLTMQTDYALRTLMFLAARTDRSTVDEVAGLYGISTHHVAKVVNQLARMGLVRSVRGVGGGIELARSPDEIRIGDVVMAFEGSRHLLECIGTENVCVIQPFCKLKGALAEAERLQRDYLNGITLRDVMPTPRQLTKVSAD